LQTAASKWEAGLSAIAKDYDRERLRAKAVEALSYLAPASTGVYPYLDKQLNDKMARGPAREASLAVLSLGDKAASLFAKALGDEDPEVRRQAARYLGQFRLPRKEIARALVRALQDEDHRVRTEAALALGETAYTHGSMGVPPSDVVPSLIQLVATDQHFGPVVASQKALGDIGAAARKAIPVLRARVRYPRSGDIEAGYALARIDPKSDEGLDHLIKLVKGGTYVGFNACIILGRLGPQARRAIPAIEKYVKANNEYVAGVKRKVLAKISADTPPPTSRPTTGPAKSTTPTATPAATSTIRRAAVLAGVA